jgi:hypothetical protein
LPNICLQKYANNVNEKINSGLDSFGQKQTLSNINPLDKLDAYGLTGCLALILLWKGVVAGSGYGCLVRNNETCRETGLEKSL